MEQLCDASCQSGVREDGQQGVQLGQKIQNIEKSEDADLVGLVGEKERLVQTERIWTVEVGETAAVIQNL